MEHYAIHLRCSPLPSPPLHLSNSSKRYENKFARVSNFNLKFNHSNLCFPQFTTNHKVARSISHANCMINSFYVPNSKNNEGSDNKILRGINGASLVFGCILGMFNLSSMMMNSKFNMAYAFVHPEMMVAGGENSFDSMWKTINVAELEEPNTKVDPREVSVEDKKMQAVYSRKTGKKDAIEKEVDKLKKEYHKFEEKPDSISVRNALIELLLIQGKFEEANEEIDKYINTKIMSFPGSMMNATYEKKIEKLGKRYDKDHTINPEKQSIADIFLYKAIIHTKLRTGEAAKWWEEFAKTLVIEKKKKKASS